MSILIFIFYHVFIYEGEHTMKQDQDFYLSINEFSKLTGIPKERLRFYDEEDIIHPARKDEDNGYRYYLPEQIFYALMVVTLVKFNSYSLNELRAFKEDPDSSYNEVLKSQIPLLRAKFENETKQYILIRNSMEYNLYFSQFEKETPHVVEHFYPPTFITPVEPAAHALSPSAMEAFSYHVMDAIREQDITAIPFSVIISEKEFYSGRYHVSGYYTIKFTHSLKELQALATPQKSLLYIFSGSVADIKGVMDVLHGFLRERGMRLARGKNVHVSVLASDFQKQRNTSCQIRIVLPLEDCPTPNPSDDFAPLPEEQNDTVRQEIQLRFSSGDFARKCGMGKETLRFYNRNELLLPSEVDQKGYKYYTNEQVGHYYFIKMLQKSGCTIKEIRETMIDHSTSYDQIMKKCLARRKLQRLEARHYYRLAKSILEVRSSFPEKANGSQICVAYLKQIPIRCTLSPEKMEFYGREAVQNLTRHVREFCIPNNLVYFPMALTMAPEDFLDGSFRLCGHAMFDFTQYRDFSELPLQKCVCLRQSMPYREITARLQDMLDFVKERGYEIYGNVNIMITLNNFHNAAQNKFVVHVYFPIESTPFYC